MMNSEQDEIAAGMLSQFTQLYVEPVGGVAGDMLLAALLDLGADRTVVARALASSGIAALVLDTWSVTLGEDRALRVRSIPSSSSSAGADADADADAGPHGRRDSASRCDDLHDHGHHHAHDDGHHHSHDYQHDLRHDHLHDHGHDHQHGHGHVSGDEILVTLRRLDMSSRALARAERIFEVLIAAEARVHGATPETVRLHEVGELDSILDVVGISVALDTLGNPRMACAPLPSGGGMVSTAHGMLSVPVPVVRAISDEFHIPMDCVPLPFEMVTPTGIAVLAVCCEHFERLDAWENRAGLTTSRHTRGAHGTRRGVGAGSRTLPDRPNVVRVHGWTHDTGEADLPEMRRP